MNGQLEHTIVFSKNINEKNVQNLIDTINHYAFVNLYFSTNGGRLDCMGILTDFLNHRFENNSLKLTLFDFVASAGTLLLLDYEGPIYVKDLRGFLFHAPDILTNNVRKDKFQKNIEEQLVKDNDIFYERLLSLGLSKAEVKKIKEGDDVYVFRDELHRIKRDLFVAEETTTSHYVITKPSK